MIRLVDWEKRLLAWYRDNEHRPFKWGEFDCALAAAGAVTAVTGADLASDFTGRYQDAKGADRAIHQAGYADLEDLVDDRLGGWICNPYRARRGDIVLGELQNGLTLLVVMGPHAYGPDETGLKSISMDRWRKAWRI